MSMELVERIAREMEPDVWASIDGDFWDGKEQTRQASLARARAAINATNRSSVTYASEEEARADWMTIAPEYRTQERLAEMLADVTDDRLQS